MAHAEICPVCHGTGEKGKVDFHQGGAVYNKIAACHGCNGKGWVEVSDTYPPIPGEKGFYPKHPGFSTGDPLPEATPNIC